MTILSIQSHVAFGHVGNAAACFALQRLGFEVWPVHTVQFSNHTGYGSWGGRVFDGAMVRDVVGGIEARGAFGGCDAVLSGYIGDVAIGEAIVDAVARVKRANPAALYACDPVIGDFGKGEYVRPGVADFLRTRALAAADLVTPNHFELDCLAARATRTLAEALAAVDALHAAGPQLVVVTSLHTAETPADAIDLVASDGEERWRVRTPRLETSVSGTGDLIAALLLAHYLRERSLKAALENATASVFGILRHSAQARSGEMVLIAAQEELVAPSRCFTAERL
ncbi:MAG: pyridoxal kinase PdxY [Variibacter sp.]|nr:pyridoxal kinase PdxY [Variibacter sp.]